MRPKLAVLAALALGVIFAPRPVIAQDAVLEEIIVTARKREESVQDIPIAVSAFTADDIRELGLTSIDDIALYTPGFSFHSGFGRQPSLDRPTVRGQTTILNGIAGVKAVSTFVDGIYVGGLVSSVDLANVERVEIIKGPQSAQYGRGTYAGAINYVTRRPTAELAGEFSVSGAEHESYDVKGWVSGPLSEGRAYFRIAAGYDQYGGEHVNTLTDDEVGGQKTTNVSAKLFLTPNDQFEATLAVTYQKVDDDHFAMALQGREHNNCCFRGPPSDGFDLTGVTGPRAREYYIGEVKRNLPVALLTEEFDSLGGAGNRQDRISASLRMHYQLQNGWTLSSLTGNIDDENESFFDATYGGYDFGVASVNNLPPPWRNLTFTSFGAPGGRAYCILFAFCGLFMRVGAYDQADFSQELRLSSPSDRPFRATAGLYYYRGKKYETRDDKVIPDAVAALGFGLVARTVSPSSNLADEDVTNNAVFGALEWDINEKWAATLEARWATDDVSLIVHPTGDRGSVLGEYTEEFTTTNPRATLSYRPDDSTNFYLNVSKGSKPGGFNANVPLDAAGGPDESFRAYEEEEAWNYEVGYKARLMEGRMALNIAAYRTEAEAQQFTLVVEHRPGQSTSIVDNLGQTGISGVEVEVEALVAENLTLNLGYAWAKAEIKEYLNTDQADLNGADGSLYDDHRLGSAVGNRIPRIPEHQASLVGRYEGGVMASGFAWFLVGDVVYEGSRYGQIHNLIETGAMTRVGLRLGVRRDTLEITLWGKNLFDDDAPLDVLRYIDRRGGTLAGCARIPGCISGEVPNASSTARGFAISLPRGRQVGVSLTYSF